MPELDDNHLAAWADLLIPGDGAAWPSASAALGAEGAARCLVAALGANTCDAWFGGIPSTETLAIRETASRDAFENMIAALYRAYYTSPMARAVIDKLAVSGPLEPSPYFDVSLLARATTSGGSIPSR